VTLHLTRGNGKLTLTLTSNRYSFSAKQGATLKFTAHIVDPDGKPITGVSVVFTISIAGLPTDVKQAKTNSAGTATVTVSIGPRAANSGRNHTGLVVASADTPAGHAQRSLAITTRN
jgi:hypothetical protein